MLEIRNSGFREIGSSGIRDFGKSGELIDDWCLCADFVACCSDGDVCQIHLLQ